MYDNDPIKTTGDAWFLIYKISARLSNVVIYFFPEERWSLFAPPYNPERKEEILEELRRDIERLNFILGIPSEISEKVSRLDYLLDYLAENEFSGISRRELVEIKNELENYMREGAQKCKETTLIRRIEENGGLTPE